MQMQLVYRIPKNIQTVGSQINAFENAPVLDPPESDDDPTDKNTCEFLGLVLPPFSDVVAAVGVNIQRTLVFDLEPKFLDRFPTDQTKIAACSNLFRGRIELLITSYCSALTPVVLP